ncbi:Oidioi.mRNA.OKI2018_I69.chr1.g980.t1.cds [Oikopleura dioica]|uniref:Oidioi.mRNA.OKI2018_I69.PAR.g12804.t1.cds n=1 Tax=Oikopleura dioica TaxID=34765 RepID=A0ABN7S2A3_OIKDI|nr:Oidioi.mRNA.OKI2018_I69.PAR.g12804.t1.cds [Oikopleura dioica]CAG5103876.1 Oidioi.mRNA.OKI2018_I69.chr1.g980.t1.cds [Oikopleura dioica]
MNSIERKHFFVWNVLPVCFGDQIAPNRLPFPELCELSGFKALLDQLINDLSDLQIITDGLINELKTRPERIRPLLKRYAQDANRTPTCVAWTFFYATLGTYLCLREESHDPRIYQRWRNCLLEIANTRLDDSAFNFELAPTLYLLSRSRATAIGSIIDASRQADQEREQDSGNEGTESGSDIAEEDFLPANSEINGNEEQEQVLEQPNSMESSPANKAAPERPEEETSL